MLYKKYVTCNNYTTNRIQSIPKYPAITLIKQTKETDLSLIEFASNFKDIKLYFLAMFSTLNTLYSEIKPTARKVLKIMSGFIISV